MLKPNSVYFKHFIKPNVTRLRKLTAEFDDLRKVYNDVSAQLFFAADLNDMVQHYKSNEFAGLSPLLSEFDNHFLAFFPKKFNRFNHKLGFFSSFGFGYLMIFGGIFDH